MKILVTGASGNVGMHVVTSLTSRGEQVVAAGRNEASLASTFADNVNVVARPFDFTNPSCFETALKNVDRVFLMRPPHLGKPEDLLPFVRAMAQADIKLVSFLSLMGVEKNPVPPHHKIEKLIEEYHLPYAHIRPGFFMQNLSGIHALEIKEQNQIFVPAGRSKTSFIDTQDIGEAGATLLHAPERYKNTAHTITGPESLDYYQVASILTDVLGREIRYAKPSLLRYRSTYLRERGLDAKYVNITVMLYCMTRLGTAAAVTNEFQELTGRNPRTFRQFAEDNIAAWQ